MNTPVETKYEASRARKYQLGLSRYYKIPAVQSTLNVVLSLFVAAFFIMFALRPTFVTIVKLQKNIADSTKTLKTLDDKVTALQKAATNLEKIKSFLPAIEASIPSVDAGYPSLISTMEILAQESGTVLSTSTLGETVLYSRIFAPYAPSKTENIIKLPFTVRVTGGYSEVTKFLESVLQMDRIINIETLTYAREGNTKGSTIATISLTITGEAYYLADEAQLLKALPIIKKNGR